MREEDTATMNDWNSRCPCQPTNAKQPTGINKESACHRQSLRARGRIAARMLLRAGVVCVALLFPAVAAAKTFYVSWNRPVPVRADTNIASQPIATLKTGQAVTVIGAQGNYYLITLPDGTRGYVFKEYLATRAPGDVKPPEAAQKTQPPQPPVRAPEEAHKTPPPQQSAPSVDAPPQLPALQQQVEELGGQIKELEGQIKTQVEAQVKAQTKDLMGLRTERARQEADKQQAQATASLPTALTNKLPTQQETPKEEHRLLWFLAGAGVVLIGWLLSWFLTHQRTRPRRIFFK